MIWVVIIVIIVILIIIVYNTLNTPKLVSRKATQFNNGDLLAVCIPNLSGKLVKIFTGSNITHVSMIVNIDNYPNVLEVGYYRNFRGSCIMPLDKWIDKYGDFTILHSRIKDQYIPSTESIINSYNKYAPCDIDMNFINWLKTLTFFSYKDYTRTKYYCTEFIALILQDLDIMEKIYNAGCYTPNNLVIYREQLYDKYFDVYKIDLGNVSASS